MHCDRLKPQEDFLFRHRSISGRTSNRARAVAPFLVTAAMIFAGQAVAPARPQTAGPQRAGRIVAAIPDETVDRAGSITPLPISVNDLVYWADVLRTQNNGRLRVQLLGGSLLNIGPRSSMQVIQHDPITEQTQIELTVGHLRGVIKTLTKPGASFEVLTPTSVIGVVGTIFEVEATETAAHIRVIKGKVKVRNRNSRVKGEQIVNEGEEAHVARNHSPEKPKPFNASEKKSQEVKEQKEEQRLRRAQRKKNKR